MTTFLDWRPEPMMEVPEVRLVPLPPSENCKVVLVECLDLNCGYNNFADDKDSGEEERLKHIEWHEEGCPE